MCFIVRSSGDPTARLRDSAVFAESRLERAHVGLRHIHAGVERERGAGAAALAHDHAVVWTHADEWPSCVEEAQRPTTARSGMVGFRHMPSGM